MKPAQAPRRILVIRTDRLGETLLTLPAIHALRRARPTDRLLMMVSPALVELLAGHPDLDEVRSEPLLRGAWWQRAWRLSHLWRAWQIDTIVISNPKKDYHLAAWLAGIPTRVGYDRKWGWALTHRLSDDKALGEHHEVEYNQMLLTVFGISSPLSPSLQLPVGSQEEQRVVQLLGQLGVNETERVVAVHPWTSNPRKQWPVARMQTLISRVSELPGVRPIVVGGQEEQSRVSEVLEEGTTALNLVGRLSLKELAACLRRARVLVTNDSGPMHVAAAVGTPVVALFGTEEAGSHPRRWGPWGLGHTVIQKPLDEITVEEVTSAVRRYL